MFTLTLRHIKEFKQKGKKKGNSTKTVINLSRSRTGGLPVSKKSLEYMLSEAGVGNAMVIIIGGAEESLACSPGVNTVVMKQRKGFVRLALENG